ncbi:MAG: helix-turn-helix transcriptional regulator [Candidatus Omnitrophota bacterium]|nr:helix-turn-helix transcriptional regulator [Candidatus Omnitrophota bacterium]
MKEPKDIIKQTRKEKRITIIELAERMGVSQAYIAKLERGDIELIGEQAELILSVIADWPEDETLYHQYRKPL